jgi:hypothetical protein
MGHLVCCTASRRAEQDFGGSAQRPSHALPLDFIGQSFVDSGCRGFSLAPGAVSPHGEANLGSSSLRTCRTLHAQRHRPGKGLAEKFFASRSFQKAKPRRRMTNAAVRLMKRDDKSDLVLESVLSSAAKQGLASPWPLISRPRPKYLALAVKIGFASSLMAGHQKRTLLPMSTARSGQCLKRVRGLRLGPDSACRNLAPTLGSHRKRDLSLHLSVSHFFPSVHPSCHPTPVPSDPKCPSTSCDPLPPRPRDSAPPRSPATGP